MSIVLAGFLLAFLPAQAPAEEKPDAISRMKLKSESLPSGIEILRETSPTPEQLIKTRKKIGFPLTALLNQTIGYEEQQAQVNYMIVPNEKWLGFGYSKLMKREGYKSLIAVKDGVLVQMVATTKELEDWLVLLLRLDKVQSSKIRFHRSPKDWELVDERFLSDDELRLLEDQSGAAISRGVMQDLMIKRSKVKIQYYDCQTEESADLVGDTLAGKESSIMKRSIRGYGPVVVSVESSSEELNEYVLRYVDY